MKSQTKRDLKRGVQASVIVLAAFIVFFNSLLGGFVLDDLIHVVNNPHIRSLGRLPELFTMPTFPGNLYRPLVLSSFSIDFYFFGLDPLPYHVTNVTLHAIVSILVFLFLRRFMSDTAAFVTGVIFAVHPVHTEVVSSIYGRTELLSSFFVLLALCLLFRESDDAYKGCLSEIGVGVCFFLALLSKESSICLLLLYPLCKFFLRREKPGIKGWSSAIFLVVPLILYFALRFYALGSLAGPAAEIPFIDNPLASLGWPERMVNSFALLGKYIALCVAPVVLSADYSFAQIDFFSLANVISLIYLLVSLTFFLTGVLGLGKQKEYSVFCLWFFLAFIVTSNFFFPIGTIFAERLLYLPGIGIVALVVTGVMGLETKSIKALFIFAVIFLFISRTLTYTQAWISNENLHSYQLVVSPHSAKTQLNYALVVQKKNYGEAQMYLDQALRIYPKYAYAAETKGAMFFGKGDFARAEEWFKKSIELDPEFVDGYISLGKLYLLTRNVNQKNKVEAEKQFKKALEKDPASFKAQLGILSILIERGDYRSAVKLRDHLVKWNPGNKILRRLIADLDRVYRET